MLKVFNEVALTVNIAPEVHYMIAQRSDCINGASPSLTGSGSQINAFQCVGEYSQDPALKIDFDSTF